MFLEHFGNLSKSARKNATNGGFVVKMEFVARNTPDAVSKAEAEKVCFLNLWG